MEVYAKTDIGNKRKTNQDFFYCRENDVGSFPNLFIVADGMGGHKAGDCASRLCVDAMVESVKNSKHKTPVMTLEQAVTVANKKIHEAAQADAALEGMGTTMVTCTVGKDRMVVANVGDSRLYLLHGTLQQITNDHSLVEELVKKGNITESEARVHPQKNIITRALGIVDEVCADFFEVPVQSQDVILLCSDGLTNMLEDDRIEYVIKHSKNLESAGDALVKQANQNGGDDNITVVLARVD